MAEVTYREATADDVESLAALRWEMEAERHPERSGAISYEDYIARYAAETRGELERGAYHAWIAEADGQAVACVLLILWVVPPTPERLHRRRGFVSAVYTQPTYRRQGISRRLMELLIAYAQAQGVERLILWASDMGRPLYASLGFVASRGMEMNQPYQSYIQS